MPSLEDFAKGPDLAHAAIAQATLDALARIEKQVARTERVFLLLKGTGLGLRGVLNVLVGAQASQAQVQQALTTQAEQIAELKAAVDALTPPTPLANGKRPHPRPR